MNDLDINIGAREDWLSPRLITPTIEEKTSVETFALAQRWLLSRYVALETKRLVNTSSDQPIDQKSRMNGRAR